MSGPNHAALDAHIARIRKLGELAKDSAPEVAVAVKGELGAQIAAGTDPDGKPWPPTQAGTPALQNAAAALKVRSVGDVVIAEITGHHALHHQGRVRGGVRRQILPTEGIPATVEKAIEKVVGDKFKRTMAGQR
jgi:hypothetical protein